MNAIPSLPVDRDSGFMSAMPGYRLSFISLLSVKLISQDNKGTIPLRQRMNHLNDEDKVFVWTDPSVSICVCVASVQQSGLLSAKHFENKLVSQSQHAAVYLKICLSFIYEMLNWKLKLFTV